MLNLNMFPYFIFMEYPQVIPIFVVITLGLLVYLLGFRKPVLPPSFEELDDEEKKLKKKKSKEGHRRKTLSIPGDKSSDDSRSARNEKLKKDVKLKTSKNVPSKIEKDSSKKIEKASTKGLSKPDIKVDTVDTTESSNADDSGGWIYLKSKKERKQSKKRGDLDVYELTGKSSEDDIAKKSSEEDSSKKSSDDMPEDGPWKKTLVIEAKKKQAESKLNNKNKTIGIKGELDEMRVIKDVKEEAAIHQQFLVSKSTQACLDEENVTPNIELESNVTDGSLTKKSGAKSGSAKKKKKKLAQLEQKDDSSVTTESTTPMKKNIPSKIPVRLSDSKQKEKPEIALEISPKNTKPVKPVTSSDTFPKPQRERKESESSEKIKKDSTKGRKSSIPTSGDLKPNVSSAAEWQVPKKRKNKKPSADEKENTIGGTDVSPQIKVSDNAEIDDSGSGDPTSTDLKSVTGKVTQPDLSQSVEANKEKSSSKKKKKKKKASNENSAPIDTSIVPENQSSQDETKTSPSGKPFVSSVVPGTVSSGSDIITEKSPKVSDFSKDIIIKKDEFRETGDNIYSFPIDQVIEEISQDVTLEGLNITSALPPSKFKGRSVPLCTNLTNTSEISLTTSEDSCPESKNSKKKKRVRKDH